MKKIFFLALIFTLVCTLSASAQKGDGYRFHPHRQMWAYHQHHFNRFERMRFHHGEFRHSFRDGSFGTYERRHFAMMRMHERREWYRYRHNDRGRLI